MDPVWPKKDAGIGKEAHKFCSKHQNDCRIFKIKKLHNLQHELESN
jgi:hypothetical protein